MTADPGARIPQPAPLAANAVGLRALLSHALLVGLFALFLTPVQVGGFGYNYSFLLLPLVWVLLAKKACRPAQLFAPVIAMYFLIFVAATLYQFEYYDELPRRVISFVLFMSIFSYIFMKIDQRMIEAFKDALVFITILLSLQALVVFFLAGGSSALGFEAKNVVGSQRVGFVYLFAFWIVYLRPASRWGGLVKGALLLIILCGLSLTFSRSSIIGLIASLALFALLKFARWLRRPDIRGFVRGVLAAIVLVLGSAILYSAVPLVFDFFGEHLFAFLGDNAAIQEDLGNMYSTGGTRVYLWQQIIAYTSANPLTGSGFLGVWVLPGLGGNFVSSAHSQYGDVLFRTGIAGALVYCYLLVLLLRLLYREQPALFWGLVAVLVYGNLHETFKEAHGGFILAFLLGMLSQSMRRRPRGDTAHPAAAAP